MSIQQLLQPIIEGGIHSTNFFNGRRLTAEDLDREKKANRQHERLLGQAIGEGVVSGLEVGLPGGSVSGGTTLEIQKGLAVNRNGDVLSLPAKIKLVLVPPSDKEHKIKDDFLDCTKMRPIEYPSNTGVYVLLIGPATDLTGRAPMSSIPNNGSVVGCGKSDLVEGVQFKVVKMDLDGPAFEGLKEETRAKLFQASDDIDDFASVSMFRNIVAHACFGTEEKEKYIADPFANNDYFSYGAIDKLRSPDDDASDNVTDYDVPIAIFRWTEKKIQFVDLWSVRRRPYGLIPSANWPTLISPEHRAIGEAMFFQFQEHVEQLTSLPTPKSLLSSVEATNYFRFLPPVGMIPMMGLQSSRGFDYLKFFNNLTFRDPLFIEGIKVQPLIRLSFFHTAIDLNRQEMIWLYLVRENRESIDKNLTHIPQPIIVFTNGYIPCHSDAQFDLSHWDYSNYGPCVSGCIK